MKILRFHFQKNNKKYLHQVKLDFGDINTGMQLILNIRCRITGAPFLWVGRIIHRGLSEEKSIWILWKSSKAATKEEYLQNPAQ